MAEFWQYFATGVTSFLAGVMVGKAMGVTQMVMMQAKSAQQQMPGMLPPGMMPMSAPRPTGLPNGPMPPG